MASSASDQTTLRRLIFAARTGEVETMEEILATHAHLVNETQDGYTALKMAVMQGHKNCVQSLLRLGASADRVSDMEDRSPLHIATSQSRLDLVQLLLDHGADPNALIRENDVTAIMLAARAGASEVMELLLRHGAEVNAQDREGRTALHYVLEFGQDHCVRILLTHGADPNIEDMVRRLNCWIRSVGSTAFGHSFCEEGRNHPTPLQAGRTCRYVAASGRMDRALREFATFERLRRPDM